MKQDNYTSWEPRINWLILLPSRSSSKQGDLYIPESVTKKNNSGICIKAGDSLDKEIFLGMECFFASHSEFGVLDTDTGWMLYIVEVSRIIMIRKPPLEIDRFSREKVTGLTFETITHDQSS